MRSYLLPAGEGRAIVQLRTGEYICVDTNSFEAIEYMIDASVEPENRQIFRRFLTPKSNVLDIGANFGLYTVTSKWVTRGSGRIYSFEPNPRTFQILQRSAYANKMLSHPQVTLVNAAVGAKAGQAVLFNLPDELGGARLMNPSHWEGRSVSVPVQVVTVDDYLPSNMEVDLVKIDVEGFEPFAIQGMEKTIARSRNIRIMIEFRADMLDETYGALKFIRYIHEIGLRVCEILPGARLKLAGPDELPAANHCLLTRTPEADCERRYFSIPADCLLVPPDFICDGVNSLLCGGMIEYERERMGDVPGESLFYGPYIDIPPGRYVVRVIGALDGCIRIRLARNFGQPIVELLLDDFEQSIEFEIPDPATNFEVIGYREAGLERVKVAEIRLEPILQ